MRAVPTFGAPLQNLAGGLSRLSRAGQHGSGSGPHYYYSRFLQKSSCERLASKRFANLLHILSVAVAEAEAVASTTDSSIKS